MVCAIVTQILNEVIKFDCNYEHPPTADSHNYNIFMLPELKEKIKQREAEIFIVSAALLFAIIIAGAFRLWTLKQLVGKPILQENAFPVYFLGESSESHKFVASKNGTKFYPAGCKAAERIKPENRIFFATAVEAQKAGFEATSQCSLSKP